MHGFFETFFRRARQASVILAVVALAWYSLDPAAAGEPAPPFTLPDVSGMGHSLYDYRGQVVLLNFWATWCPPCRVEMPQFQALYEQYHEQGFVVIAVASDAFGERAVPAVAEEMRLTFPILLDPDLKVTGRYGVHVRPTTYFIGRDGRLVSRVVGPQEWSEDLEVRRYIESLLAAERDPTVAHTGEFTRPSREP